MPFFPIHSSVFVSVGSACPFSIGVICNACQRSLAMRSCRSAAQVNLGEGGTPPEPHTAVKWCARHNHSTILDNSINASSSNSAIFERILLAYSIRSDKSFAFSASLNSIPIFVNISPA